MLYSDASLRVLRAFVYNTHQLSADAVAAHHVQAVDSDQTSDHMPVVADFAWTSPNTP
jgi:endonuclease/exonuclease/phosphatase family metal-dependent hydrolase